MSSDAVPALIRYVVYMPHGPKAGTVPCRVPPGSEVEDLKAAIRNHPDFKRHLQHEELILLKCEGLQISSQKTRYDLALQWIREHGEEGMDGAHLLEKYFPLGPANVRAEMIDVLAVTNSILESRDVIYALPDRHASKVIKDRLSQVERMKYFPTPSEGVKSEEKVKGWANNSSGVHLHRPTGNYGPPTALFHPALARLKHRLMHLDQIEEPDADHFEWAHKFLAVCGNGFKKEKLREGELKEIINALIGEDAIWQGYLPGKVARPDAVWGRMTRAIVELKNLDGVGGNATLQAFLDYAKILVQSEYRACVTGSNCPIILIGIMGNRLEISTAVFTDGIYSDQLLSEDFYIDAWQSETVLRVGRIFKALSLAIAELRKFYEPFADGLKTESTITHLYPNPLACQGFVIPRLNYIGKLSHGGELLGEEDKEAAQFERPYALYRAKMTPDESDEEVDVVVKFTVRYHEEAHRILAEKRLAPTLHCCIPLVGGMYIVVMDYVESSPLYLVRKPQGHEEIYSDVERAVGLLHERDLVFGDLRVQNIIPKPSGGAMLIDFDWVGKNQVDRYPASWNNDDGRCAPSVNRRVLMDKTHDTFMLEALKCRWAD